MSAANQLSDRQREFLLNGHHSLRRREMIRYWYLSKEDIRFINLRRRDHNRLGFAAQLCLLRYPGWPLGPNEIPPTNLVEFTAAQLGADPDEIRAYPTWDETRREHLSVISRAY